MPATAPSLVHNKETTGQIDPIVSFGDSLRHNCLPEYYAARHVYSHIEGGDSSPKVRNLDSCRSNAWFTRNVDSGEVRIASSACHLRWCPLCADSRRNYISHGVEEWCREQPYPKFLTLTLKHSAAPLDFQIDCLYKFFRALRKRTYFKKCVTGGVWFFQIKKSKNDNLWHPHIHCLITGRYLPHRWLKRAWLAITSSSSVVDIRPVKDPHLASVEVARYASTPCKLVGLLFDDQVELVRAMHGRRLCGTWGIARCVSLRPAKIESDGKWQNIGSWSDVYHLRNHDSNAEAIWYSYHHKLPLPAGIVCNVVDQSLESLERYSWNDLSFDSKSSAERSPPKCEEKILF